MGALKDEVQEGVVREDCHGAVKGEQWHALGTVLTERLEVTEAGQGLEPLVWLLEMLAGRENEFVDGRDVVMVGKHWALVDEMGEVKTGKQRILVDEKDARLAGKLQAFAVEWEETFGRKMMVFVAETVEVFVVQ